MAQFFTGRGDVTVRKLLGHRFVTVENHDAFDSFLVMFAPTSLIDEPTFVPLFEVLQFITVIIRDVLETKNSLVILIAHNIEPVLRSPPYVDIFHVAAREAAQSRDRPAGVGNDHRSACRRICSTRLRLGDFSRVVMLNLINLNPYRSNCDTKGCERRRRLGNLTVISGRKKNRCHVTSVSSTQRHRTDNSSLSRVAVREHVNQRQGTEPHRVPNLQLLIALNS